MLCPLIHARSRATGFSCCVCFPGAMWNSTTNGQWIVPRYFEYDISPRLVDDNPQEWVRVYTPGPVVFHTTGPPLVLHNTYREWRKFYDASCVTVLAELTLLHFPSPSPMSHPTHGEGMAETWLPHLQTHTSFFEATDAWALFSVFFVGSLAADGAWRIPPPTSAATSQPGLPDSAVDWNS